MKALSIALFYHLLYFFILLYNPFLINDHVDFSPFGKTKTTLQGLDLLVFASYQHQPLTEPQNKKEPVL